MLTLLLLMHNNISVKGENNVFRTFLRFLTYHILHLFEIFAYRDTIKRQRIAIDSLPFSLLLILLQELYQWLVITILQTSRSME